MIAHFWIHLVYICHTLWFRSILGRFTCMLDWTCIKCTLLPTRCSVALADFCSSPCTLSQGCKIDRIESRKSTEGCPTKMVFPPQTGHSLVVVSVDIYFAEFGGQWWFWSQKYVDDSHRHGPMNPIPRSAAWSQTSVNPQAYTMVFL